MVAGLLMVRPSQVQAQSVMDCRVTGRDGSFAGETMAAASSFEADVSDGFLRLLLVRVKDPDTGHVKNPDPPDAYIVVFEPFSGHRSIHGTASNRDGGDAAAEFWMATTGPGEQVVIDKWDLSSSGASHSGLTLQCPSHR
jgi:hypothetical protein